MCIRDSILTNARQTMLLQKASQALNQAVEAMKMLVPTDLIVTDLYECWNNLKEILGCLLYTSFKKISI